MDILKTPSSVYMAYTQSLRTPKSAMHCCQLHFIGHHLHLIIRAPTTFCVVFRRCSLSKCLCCDCCYPSTLFKRSLWFQQTSVELVVRSCFSINEANLNEKFQKKSRPKFKLLLWRSDNYSLSFESSSDKRDISTLNFYIFKFQVYYLT